MSERLDEIEVRLEALDNALTDFRAQLDENTIAITTLQRLGSELLDIARIHQQALRIAQQDAERDRAEFRSLILENQTEIRRIWQYLLRQHPNGRGDN